MCYFIPVSFHEHYITSKSAVKGTVVETKSAILSSIYNYYTFTYTKKISKCISIDKPILFNKLCDHDHIYNS